jgi:hypothetical protein
MGEAARIWVGNERAAAWSGGGGGGCKDERGRGRVRGGRLPKRKWEGAAARVVGGATRVRGK